MSISEVKDDPEELFNIVEELGKGFVPFFFISRFRIHSSLRFFKSAPNIHSKSFLSFAPFIHSPFLFSACVFSLPLPKLSPLPLNPNMFIFLLTLQIIRKCVSSHPFTLWKRSGIKSAQTRCFNRH